ncbi:MAG: class I SAM-dependent rRNA methyltransferase [Caldilineales bacterium]|nr:class I SAM-dependent rRNA methyltransferase [Caldilineales bacterium]
MPKSSAKTPFVIVSARLKTSLEQGHPWVYRDAVERTPPGLKTGDWVRVQCGNLQFFGLWDAEGSIAIRIFSRRNVPNRTWVREQVQTAWDLRAALRQPSAQTTAFRWLFGEGDGLPGVVADYYRDIESGESWAVLRTYSLGLARIKGWVTELLAEITPLAGIIERGDEAGGISLLAGRMPPANIVMMENGLKFEVDLVQGQKTGFFLDQRDNRQMIERWSAGRAALNLFCYTGGFSLYAVRGGAREVVSVDAAHPAVMAAKRNFEINGFDPARHEFHVADCFDLLEKYHGEGRRFDLIIVDPPSFARSKAQLPAALSAYRRLNSLALKCLTPTGLLVSGSCTAQVSPDAFRAMLAEAAVDARCQLRILHEAGHALDHPVPAGFPEGRYLKFVVAAASEWS